MNTEDTEAFQNLDADLFCQSLQLQSTQPSDSIETVETEQGLYNFNIRKWECKQEIGEHWEPRGSVVFLHGFLGSPHDWDAIAAGISLQADCLAISMPCHNSTHPSLTSGLDASASSEPGAASSIKFRARNGANCIARNALRRECIITYSICKQEMIV